MGYGGGKIVKQTDKFSKKIFAYYNPVGKLYAKFVFLGRILAVGVFLDDLFKSQPSIKCDTKQVGCELSCKNRFAPVSHVQIWQFNLFLGLLSSIIFTVFNMLNQRNYESYQRRMVHKNPIYDGRGNSFEIKYYWEKTKEGKTIINSGYIAVGYIAMLVFRLTYLLICVFLEINLGKHISQNSNSNEYFDVGEKWICPTNNADYQQGLNHYVPEDFSLINFLPIDKLLPVENRTIFYRSDPVFACQQETAVPCWIPHAYMVSYGLKFMFGILILEIFLTLLELFYELAKPCTGQNRGLFSRKFPVENQAPVMHQASIDAISHDYHNLEPIDSFKINPSQSVIDPDQISMTEENKAKLLKFIQANQIQDTQAVQSGKKD